MASCRAEPNNDTLKGSSSALYITPTAYPSALLIYNPCFLAVNGQNGFVLGSTVEYNIFMIVKCAECSKVLVTYKSVLKRGRGKYCSRKCSDKNTLIKNGQRISPKTEFKKGHMPKHAGKPRPGLAGKNHWNWKGGISRPSCTFKVKQWICEVIHRDGSKCVECDSTKKLHAHHIKSWENYPRLRYNISNGKTLCYGCHHKLHYRKNNTDSLGRFIPGN